MLVSSPSLEVVATWNHLQEVLRYIYMWTNPDFKKTITMT